jgi:hypothetical protein
VGEGSRERGVIRLAAGQAAHDAVVEEDAEQRGLAVDRARAVGEAVDSGA